MALIRTQGGATATLTQLVLGTSNSGAAGWNIIPAELVEKYSQVRLATQAEAEAVVPTESRYGNYNSALQMNGVTLTSTPTSISSLTPLSNGAYEFRVNAIDAYCAIVLIP